MYEISETEISNPYAVSPATSGAVSGRNSDGAALSQTAETRAIAEVKAQVIMARQFPRDPQHSVDNILRECKRPTLADAAIYSYPRGNEIVTGPSIRLAEVMARNWGNMTFGYEVLDRKKTVRGTGCSVIRAFAWDLETNTYISRQFTVLHWRATRSGGYPISDDRDIYELEANMAARRMRACILQTIPGDVTQAAVDACRYTSSFGLAERMKNSEEREKIVARTVKVYEKMGVGLSDLEEHLGAKVDDWSPETMIKLKELKNSIDDGVLAISDVFPHLAANEKSAPISKEQTSALMKAAKETGRQSEISDALKKIGIAKFADTPASRYDEVVNLIAGFADTDKGNTEESSPTHPKQP